MIRLIFIINIIYYQVCINNSPGINPAVPELESEKEVFSLSEYLIYYRKIFKCDSFHVDLIFSPLILKDQTLCKSIIWCFLYFLWNKKKSQFFYDFNFWNFFIEIQMNIRTVFLNLFAVQLKVSITSSFIEPKS